MKTITFFSLFPQFLIISQADVRWRTASNSKIAAETDTLSESKRPNIGMRMWAVAAARHCSVSPVDSVPMTMAVGPRMSVS